MSLGSRPLACLCVASAGVTGLSCARLASGQVALTDVTAAAGLSGFVHAPNALAVPGFNEWIMGGIGVGDFDGDGWPDLFVPRGGTGLDRLFLNNRDGTFTDRAAAWGVAQAHAGNGVAAADYDGDGDVDLYVTSYGLSANNAGQAGKNRLYRNEGGSFTQVAVEAGVAFTTMTGSAGDGIAWGDVDLDGDLDLVVAAWSPSLGGNRLFLNDGDGTFTDVTGDAIYFGGTWGFQPTVVDFTGDGWPDILLAADFETGRAYRNLRDGSFQLATQVMGLGLDDNGMGSCVADFDRDGDPDWFVTSVHMTKPTLGMYNGSTMYINRGDGVCTEEALLRGVSDGGWGWGLAAVDLDHDGWEDIVEVNGRNAGQWANEQEYVYRNVGGGFFERLGAETGLTLAGDARCVTTLDYDRDGDLDVLILQNAGGLRLYRNDVPAERGSIVVELVSDPLSRCAPHGYGAVVRCATGKSVQRRWVHGGSGFRTNQEHLVHFGLAGAPTVDELVVEWASGQTTVLGPVDAGERIVVAAPRAADLDADGRVGARDLALLLAEWGRTDAERRATRRAELDGDGVVGLGDLQALLEAWTGR
ncbi:MAG: hypothetical protein RIS86_1817 [Planctomycetota bacterium]